MDLSNRHYSKQSHMLVNAKYALTKNESILIFWTLFDLEIKRRDRQKIFQRFMFLTSKDLGILNPLNKWGL